ncbi:MAG TPA: Flp pilus assembly protein CpaB, partial [Chthonomonadaceae bacterium]|nr:Flp pilus assembly protein CpaB [Chthonomonadaceae bacterium]
LDPISGVAGFLKPGDRVDVLATFDAGNGQAVTRTVLQNIPLLAIGSQVMSTWTPETKPAADGNGAGSAAASAVKPQEVPNATVMVSPADAQTLVLAAARGKLHLILRPADDTAPVHVPALNSAFVTGAPLPTPAPPRVAAPPSPAPTRRALPLVEAAFYRRAPQPAPAPASASKAPVVHRVIKLDGVVLDTNSFAMLSEGNLSYFRKVGDFLAGYKVIKMTENGITMKKPGQPAVLWEIGQKWEE